MVRSPEDRLTDWVRRTAPGGEAIGDDVARLARLGGAVATVDQQIEGTHFPEGLDPRIVARRLLEVNLSDLAASGAVPDVALLALAAPAGFDYRQFMRALSAACVRREVALVGGDTARAPHLAAAMTLIGRRAPGGRFVGRAGARPGDRLWLGATVGESAMGRRLVELGARAVGRTVTLPGELALSPPLARAARRAVRRHLLPLAQLTLGSWLARRHRAAAIDVSDGLALDLTRLCRASGVGARLDIAALPLAADAERLGRRLEREPLACALGGGEDYALLFALPPGVAPPAGSGAKVIGRICEGDRIVQSRDGRVSPLPPSGWDHLGSAAPG